jgi:phosphohistidine swiveling domain-containing protein
MLKALEDIYEADKEQFGCKAFYLGALIREGMLVPKGFAVTSTSCLEKNPHSDVESWAVRSSGHDEDQMHESKAGQYQSYLDVRDLQAGIEKCFQENQVASVIAQEMITSDYGGVCFSSSIERGDAVDIELCLGHNAGVTQGKGQVARVRGNKSIDDPHGLLTHVSMLQLAKLAAQATLIESRWGFPVDIEWCVRGEDLFLLQARPITGLSTTARLEAIQANTLKMLREDAAAQGFGLWTDASIGDMFRHPSRLFLDLVNYDHGELWSVRRVFRDLGLKPASRLAGPLFVSICDRAYIHVGNYFDLLFPGCAVFPAKKGVGVKRRAGLKSWMATFAQASRVLFVVPFRFRSVRRRLARDYSQTKLNALQQEARDYARADLQNLELHELFDRFDHLMKRLSDEAIYAHLMSDVIAGFSHALVRVWLRVLFGSSADSWEFRLTTGIDGNFNTETTLALEDLARGRIPLEAFLERFGHRGNPDWDLASPRWREQPEKVQQMAAAILASNLNHREQFLLQVAEREKAEQELNDYLSAKRSRLAIREFVFRQLRYLQLYSPLREKTQSVVFAFVEALRGVIVAIGDKTKLGEDVFALTKVEFDALRTRADMLSELKPIVAERKRENQLAKRIYLPHVFDANDLHGELFRPNESSCKESMLKGTRVSRGFVVGRARVVKDLSEATNLGQGDIVVTQFADPSFASLLLSAGGLVLEQGSVYSHTAIIAREFGLPALVNVERATHKIKDGQEIRLDADKGEIWLSEAHSASLSVPSAVMM